MTLSVSDGVDVLSKVALWRWRQVCFRAVFFDQAIWNHGPCLVQSQCVGPEYVEGRVDKQSDGRTEADMDE